MKRILIISVIIGITAYLYGDYKKPYVQYSTLKIATSDEFLVRDYKYPLNNLFDNDLTTAYVFSGKKDNYLIIDFTDKSNYISKLGITAGYLKNKEVFQNNNKITVLELVINGNEKRTLSMQDTFEVQYFDVNSVITNLRINILEVKKGDKFNDTCISELKFLDKNSSNINIEGYNILCTGGEYPNYSILKDKKEVFNPASINYKEGIINVKPSPDFNMFAFETSEVGNMGLIIYNGTSNKSKILIKDFWVQEVQWLNNETIKYVKYNADDQVFTNEMKVN